MFFYLGFSWSHRTSVFGGLTGLGGAGAVLGMSLEFGSGEGYVTVGTGNFRSWTEALGMLL